MATILSSLPAMYVLLGLLGTFLEGVGVALQYPRLVAVGKTLEAIGADTPKIAANLRGAVRGAPPILFVLAFGAAAALGGIVACTGGTAPTRADVERGLDALCAARAYERDAGTGEAGASDR